MFCFFSACARESTPEDYNPEQLPHKGDYKGKFTIVNKMYIHICESPETDVCLIKVKLN